MFNVRFNTPAELKHTTPSEAYTKFVNRCPLLLMTQDDLFEYSCLWAQHSGYYCIKEDEHTLRFDHVSLKE